MQTHNILVVDDDTSTAQAIATHLRKLGYGNIITASSPAEAIDLTNKNQPDLVIIDIRLGDDIDGIEVANRIAAKYSVPVVFITAYGDDSILKRAEAVKPYGFINKPVRKQDLKSTVSMALQRFATDNINPGQAANDPDFRLLVKFDHNGNVLGHESRGSGINTGAAGKELDYYLPLNHGELLQQCLSSHEVLYLVEKKDKEIYSWEYRYDDAADIVELTVIDITQQYTSIDQSIRNSVLTEALDRLVTGIIITNTNLKVFYCNKAAERIISNNKVLHISNNYIDCRDTGLNARLRQNIVGKLDETFIISKTVLSRPVQLLITPLSESFGSSARDLPVATIYLFESVQQPERIENVIRAMYGLSRTEARIVAHLVWNPHIEEVADILDISYNTVRTHLKRIYLKTNTKNLSSLIHMIVTGPAGLLLHSIE